MRDVVRKLVFIFSVVLLVADCGGGSNTIFGFLQSPVDLRASTTDISFRGRSTRFVYVADAFSRSINIIDQLSEQLIDTDRGDNFDFSPLAVGGQPEALVVHDRSGLMPRIFVADMLNRRILAYEVVTPSDPNSLALVHQPVSLGAVAVGIGTRAMFQDVGRTSTPTFTDLAVNAALAQNELWEVTFQSPEEGYQVVGSKSGIQTGRALEDKTYTSDSGAISFTIRSGSEKTNSGDVFRVTTGVANPLALVGRPVDLQIEGTNLFVVTSDPASVVVVNLDTLTAAVPIPLVDGLLVLPIPGRTSLRGGHLYIPNQASPNLFDMKTSDLTVQVINTGVRARAAGTDLQAKTLFLMPVGERQTALWDLVASAALPPIRLSDYGTAFGTYTLDGTDFGLVPTVGGGMDVLNVTQRSRVDTRVTGDATQSQAVAKEFFDVLPASSPDLIAVTTVDGVTRTERWQLVFEGVIPATSNLNVTVAGDRVTGVGTTFQKWGIQAGDLLTLNPAGAKEEVVVGQVNSETSLTLASIPQIQAAAAIEIRPSKSYVVFGSISGAQKGRVTEGVSYTSDDGSISLTIRASRTALTTRGDFFAFLTTEGIDPVLAPDKRLGRAVAVFTRPGDLDPTAYVAQQGSGTLSILNLRTHEERGSIR